MLGLSSAGWRAPSGQLWRSLHSGRLLLLVGQTSDVEPGRNPMRAGARAEVSRDHPSKRPARDPVVLVRVDLAELTTEPKMAVGELLDPSAREVVGVGNQVRVPGAVDRAVGRI